MRWLRVSSGSAIIAVSLWACAGAPFSVGPVPDDATSTDARGDAPGATVDATDGPERDATDATADATADAAAEDARDARDAPADRRDGDGDDGDGTAEDAPADSRIAEAAVDAALPHCGTGYLCAASVPSGWTGPFALYSGAAAPPGCDAAFGAQVLDAKGGLTAGGATCGCACGAATGVQCSVPKLSFFASTATCSLLTAADCATVTLVQGACTAVNVGTACGTALGVAVTLPTSTASQGSCTPVGASGVPALTWTTSARACLASAAPLAPSDCGTGAACLPAPSSAFQSSLCIERSGDVACPATGYTTRTVYYGGADDTRGCSACTCGAVLGASCSGTVQQFTSSNGTCATPQVSYPLGQSCDSIQQPADLQMILTAAGGACAPGAVTAMGTATPSSPMTFCCAP